MSIRLISFCFFSQHHSGPEPTWTHINTVTRLSSALLLLHFLRNLWLAFLRNVHVAPKTNSFFYIIDVLTVVATPANHYTDCLILFKEKSLKKQTFYCLIFKNSSLNFVQCAYSLILSFFCSCLFYFTAPVGKQ